MPPEPVTYKLDETGYVRLNQALSRRGWRWTAAVLLVVYVSVHAVDVARGYRLDPVSLLIMPVIFVAVFSALYFYYVPRRARGIFREQANMREEKHLALSESGVEFFQASGSFHTDWTSFVKWHETADFLLLYVNRALMLPVPLAQIGDARAAFIRERMIASGLPRGKRRK